MLSCSQTAAGFVLTDAVTCTQIAFWLDEMLPLIILPYSAQLRSHGINTADCCDTNKHET